LGTAAPGSNPSATYAAIPVAACGLTNTPWLHPEFNLDSRTNSHNDITWRISPTTLSTLKTSQ